MLVGWDQTLVFAQQSETSQPADQEQVNAKRVAAQIPTPENLVMLVRSSLLTLNDALLTGNFTVLRDKASRSFHRANSAARLSRIFSSLMKQRIDLSFVTVAVPNFTDAPRIDDKNQLHIAGNFPLQESQVNFKLIFVADSSKWRLVGISVNPGPKVAEAQVNQPAKK